MQSFGAWLAVNLFAEGGEGHGRRHHAGWLIDAMSTITIDTPAGPYSMSQYQDMYVGTGNYYMMETKKVGDRIAWVPVYTYEGLLHEQK